MGWDESIEAPLCSVGVGVDWEDEGDMSTLTLTWGGVRVVSWPGRHFD